MATYILYWNATDWEWDTLQQNIAAIKDQGYHSIIWNVGYGSQILKGDRVFILRLGPRPSGIVASGFVAQSTIEQPGSIGTKAIELNLDNILDAERDLILSRSELSNGIFKDLNWIRPGRIFEVPAQVVNDLENRWSQLVSKPIPPRPIVEAPKNYYSCFISYSSADELFARRLHNDLQMNGVRVWFAPEDLKIGDPLKPTIDEAVENYDKLILVLSENSINSAWVRHEFSGAAKKEKQQNKLVLFPIRLDDSVFETTEKWAYDIRQRQIGDFTKWDNPLIYQNAINRLLHDLNTRPVQQTASDLAKQAAAEDPIPTAKRLFDLKSNQLPQESHHGNKIGSVRVGQVPSPVFIQIPAGKFLMGISDAEVKRVWRLKATRSQASEIEDRGFFKREQPKHEIFLATYFIGKNLVTNSDYQYFIKATGYSSPREWLGTKFPEGLAMHPVVNISWEDAVTYCEWLTETLHRSKKLREDELIRLPTEAEWEKAATWNVIKQTKSMWAWGNTWDKSKCNTREGGAGMACLVGMFSPAGDSALGVSDMTGNVWEWCNSLFRAYPYDMKDGRENWQGGGQRVARGGSYASPASYSRCTVRLQVDSSSRVVDFGFRCVKSPIV